MATRSLRIFTEPLGPGRGIWWWVRIYDNVEQMRRAGARYDAAQGKPATDWSRTMGVCQANGYRERYVNGRWVTVLPPNKLGGVIRLARPFTLEQAGHECMHAALVTYRQAVRRRANFGDNCGPREEDLCYLTGELLDQLFSQF